ncbi:DUF1684 domain-containing protein [Hymenobacter sp. BT175]|uniref:DUF1684 domain-containing protein n=1 Tax=Hymenobacter translucens TaxID=2886507 RepID=UPI001D0DC1FB|nr:DUF1684 domain-containing protein [Hymenobacter translucens]MCC2547664.1 DUF1684 domain-containing protein [Hymenobacter translucens]
MKVNFKLLIGLGLLVVFGYVLKDLFLNDNQYILRLRQERQEKNDTFRRPADSPLSSAEREHFDSLRYFRPSPDYRLDAKLEQFGKPDTIVLPMSDGKTEKYLRWGKASFTLPGQQAGQQLVLFLKADGRDSTLFVPFTDQTNGRETYGGGRYLDAALPEKNATELTLDFNRAYNPFCAYNDSYSCPVPPAENRLPVAIAAGEKSFPEADHTGHSH